MIKKIKALADENRLRLCHILSHSDLCVCEIEVLLEMTQSNVSRHLSKLKNVDIITPMKDAQWIHYRISDDFKNHHHKLYTYLIDQFNIEKAFTDDLIRLKRYKENKLNCQLITSDKDAVLHILKGK